MLKSRKRVVTIMVLLAAGLFGGAATLEGAYRAYKLVRYGIVDYPDLLAIGRFESDPRYGIVPKKNYRSETLDPKIRKDPLLNRVYGPQFTTNRWGYRGKEFTVEKSPDTFRMVALGESTTLCMEVSDEDTWPAQLERALQQDRGFLRRRNIRRVEMINAAVSGGRTREGMMRLEEEVRRLTPDLLLVAFTWNDFTNGMDGFDPDAVIPSWKKRWWLQSKVLENVYVRYQVWQLHHAPYWERKRQLVRRDTPWVEAYVRHLLAMRAMAAEIPAEMVLVKLPGLCRLNASPTERQLVIDQTRVTPTTFRFFAELSQFVSALTKDVGQDAGLRVIDTSDDFEMFGGAERVRLFVDEMHVTAEGAIARGVHRGVVEL
jgi:lysophospholipase L1-like esterase